MMNYEKPYVIAEAGCNHKGDMNIAKELIDSMNGSIEVDSFWNLR